MKNNNNKALIEKYLSNSLSNNERDEFEKRISNDKHFSEELKIRRLKKVVSEQIRIDEFQSELDNIHNEHIAEKKEKKKKIYMYSAIAASAAAIALLFFFIGNPLDNNRNVKSYIAMAGSSEEISILNLSGVNLKSEESIQAPLTTNISVAYIESTEDNPNYNMYFFSNDILYLFAQPDDKVSIAYKVDAEGQRIYYMCRNSIVFSFRKLKKDKLYELNTESRFDYRDFCDD